MRDGAFQSYSQRQLDLIDVCRSHCLPFYRPQLGLMNGEFIVLSRVEVLKLINPVQHIGDEFLEEDAWCNANFPAEFPRHSVCQVTDIDIVTPLGNTHRCWHMLHEEVASFVADQAQPVKIKSRKTNLHGARIIETNLRLKIDMQTLGQGFEPLDTLGAFKEGRGAGDQHVQSWESARVNLINELSQRVEALVTDITADPLNCLNLV